MRDVFTHRQAVNYQGKVLLSTEQSIVDGYCSHVQTYILDLSNIHCYGFKLFINTYLLSGGIRTGARNLLFRFLPNQVDSGDNKQR